MNLFEFIALVGIAGGLAYGFARGLETGIRDAILGALAAAGIAYLAFVVFMLLVLSALWLMLRYRPLYPRCRNGSCGYRDYKVVAVDVMEAPQLLREGQARPGSLVRCRCGSLYLHALYEHRFYEVTSDGMLHPYLRYRPYRRWESDPG